MFKSALKRHQVSHQVSILNREGPQSRDHYFKDPFSNSLPMHPRWYLEPAPYTKMGRCMCGDRQCFDPKLQIASKDQHIKMNLEAD